MKTAIEYASINGTVMLFRAVKADVPSDAFNEGFQIGYAQGLSSRLSRSEIDNRARRSGLEEEELEDNWQGYVFGGEVRKIQSSK